MCGRFKRKSDKQKIARVFEVEAGLEDIDFAPGADLRPQSMQPIVFTNEAGERQIEMMRWGFKLPDRLLFNARSEGIAQASFWKDAFFTGRAIAPGDAIFEWVRPESRPDDCPARSRDRTCRPIGSTLGGQADG
jgi:putative SOS response-associated peptidase YedK